MTDQTNDISKLDKSEVLAALYNASKPLGLGILQFDPAPMEKEEAALLLSKYKSFDYLKGRVMKVDLSGDTLDTWLYDRDNGLGAGKAVIDKLAKAATK